MPKCRLRTYDQNPPGGFFYEQRTPNKRFGPEPMIEPLAKMVQRFRGGNHLERATYPECLYDVDRYMANGPLRGQMQYVVEEAADNPKEFPLQANAPGLVPCKGCGIPVPVPS